MKEYLTITLIGLTLFACNMQTKKENPTQVTLVTNKQTPPSKKDMLFVTGNFNNDNVTDTVYEWCYSSLTNAPIKTFQIGLATDTTDAALDSVIKQKPFTKMYSNLNGVDTFMVSEVAQQQGLYYLINVGDLDGDHVDEIGYIINYADISNINRFFIVSLKNNKFTPQFNFQINEMINFLPEELIDSTFLVKALPPKSMQYKFYSDSATVELGTYTFK